MEPGECTLTKLATAESVSERTIRNDLSEIGDFLAAHGMGPLEVSRRGIVTLEADPTKVLDLLAEMDLATYHLSKEERVACAAVMLAQSTSYLTFAQISDALLVSRTTIIKEIDEIRAYLACHGLEVVSYPSKGLTLKGSESTRRAFLLEVALAPSEEESIVPARQFSVQAGDQVVVRKLLHEQESRHRCSFTEESFNRIVTYLRIMISRNLQGAYVEPQDDNDSEKYLMAQDILRNITQYCHVQTIVDEIRALSFILESARYLKGSQVRKDALRVQILTRQFIERVSEELGCDLNDDFEFFESLQNHLDSVLKPKPVDYPDTLYIQQILKDNAYVVDTVKSCDRIIENYAGRDLTKLEIDYVALHVCAALERKKNNEAAFRVVLVCSAGIGTSQLILEKLKRHFNFRVVDICSSHEAPEITHADADLIITTVPLHNLSVDSVVVSVLLTDEDYVRVGARIDALRQSRSLPSRIEDEAPNARGLIERLSPVVHEVDPDHATGIMKAVRKVVRTYFNEPMSRVDDVLSPYLHQLLPPSHIRLGVLCANWRESIRESARVLLSEGYIEPRYVDAMIANIEENGPYVVLSQGFAVPHEGIGEGSLMTGMSLIRLKHPVDFNAEELDPIEFVLCMSAPDQRTHLRAFFNLVNLLQDSAFKDALRRSQTPEEASSAIAQFEYRIS